MHGSMRRREAARCRWPSGPKGRGASRRPYWGVVSRDASVAAASRAKRQRADPSALLLLVVDGIVAGARARLPGATR